MQHTVYGNFLSRFFATPHFLRIIWQIFWIHEEMQFQRGVPFFSSTENPFLQLFHDEKYIFTPFKKKKKHGAGLSPSCSICFFCSSNVMLQLFHNRSSVPPEQMAASLFLSRRQQNCLFLIEAFNQALSPALCLALRLFSQHLPPVI